MNTTADHPWHVWQSAAADEAVDAALRNLYHDLDQQVAAGEAVCQSSGRCCSFDQFGHRLYVTGLEVAWFLRRTANGGNLSDDRHHNASPSVPLPQLAARPPSTDGCPYQVDNLCSVHTVRPMGCRVFFCQSGTEPWQQQLYEKYLARLRALHEKHELPYAYMEWRHGLHEAALCLGSQG